MAEAAFDAYIAAFDRHVRTTGSDGIVIHHPGLVGDLRAADERLRLLVTDDRALERHASLVGAAQRALITVLPAAVQVGKFLDGDGRWSTKRLTAMVCDDLARIPR